MCDGAFYQVQIPQLIIVLQGRVVRKAVNANSGLKVKGSINFPGVKMFFSVLMFCVV